MRPIHLAALLITLMTFVPQAHALFSSMAKITLRVVDENGLPIEGAKVGIGFQYNLSYGTDSREYEGVSNSEGLHTASEKINGFVGWNITKDGYYKSRGSYEFQEETALRWEPWNPIITTVLRKIENPVPMYIRDTRDYKLEIPEADKDIGFDLIKFDWVAPYGNGEKADFIFHLKRRYVSRKNYDFHLKINFSSEHDGIQRIVHDRMQGSMFILPREAPPIGYMSELTAFATWNPKEPPKGSWDSNNHYIFRIRSKKDGDSVSGMYGKIIGGIEIGRKRIGTAYVRIKYYLNPNGTRNLEHDLNRNLFDEN